jgi:hypothetical protein
LQLLWWRHAIGVLRTPRAVFEAMRDSSGAHQDARQEPVLAIILLAGIAAVLAFSGTTRELLDSAGVDGTLVPVLIFLSGGAYGFVGYWIGGLALYLGVRGAKGETSYREVRHLLAYALVPLVLSLCLLPIRAGLYGTNAFRTGGTDDGTAQWVFTGVAFVFLAWSLVVLVIALCRRFDWTPIRAFGALLLMLLALFSLAIVFGGLPAAWV